MAHPEQALEDERKRLRELEQRLLAERRRERAEAAAELETLKWTLRESAKSASASGAPGHRRARS